MCDYCVKVEFEDGYAEVPDSHLEQHDIENRDLVGVVPFHQHDGEMGGGHVTVMRNGTVSFTSWKHEKYGYGDAGWVLIHPLGEEYE